MQIYLPNRRAQHVGVSTTDLVSFWKLDESSGTRYDFFGTNDLTDNNTVGQATSLTGVPYTEAADFITANSEYLSINDNASVSTGDIDFSFSCWVRFDSVSQVQPIIYKAVSPYSSANEEYRLSMLGTGTLRWRVGNGSTSGQVDSSVSFSTGTWYHICCWHDASGNELGIRIDDSTEDTISYTSGGQDNAGVMSIGREEFAPSYFDGQVESVGFWKRLLSSAEKTALADATDPFYDQFTVVSKESLVSFWKLTESSGTRLDSHGSNDLTDNNTVGQATSITGAPYSEAADFESTNSEYLSDPDNASHASDSFTLAFWAQFESLPSSSPWPTLAAKWEALNQEWLINYTGDDIYFHCDDNGDTSEGAIFGRPDGGALSTGTWYHIAVRHNDGVGRSIWIDGVSVAADLLTTGIYNGASAFHLGGTNVGGLSDHDGLIQAVGWWDRALSDAEIIALANKDDPFYDQF